jgi:hypothetical protein
MAPSLIDRVRRVGRPTLLTLLLWGLLAGASLTVALVVLPDADATAGSGSPQAGLDVTGDSTAGRFDHADGEAATVDEGPPLQSQSAGSDSTSGQNTGDPVDSAVTEACSQFRSGSTVDEVAEWFESDWDVSPVDVEAAFREVIEQALTRECPDVVPSE